MDVEDRMHDPIFVPGKKNAALSSHAVNRQDSELAVLYQLLNTQGLSSQIHAEGFFGRIVDDTAILHQSTGCPALSGILLRFLHLIFEILQNDLTGEP